MAVAAPRWGPDGDKDGVRTLHCRPQIGGEAEPPGCPVGGDQLLEAGFEDRHLAALQPRDLLPVLIDANHRHAELGETRPRYQPDIPGPDHRYPHKLTYSAQI